MEQMTLEYLENHQSETLAKIESVMGEKMVV